MQTVRYQLKGTLNNGFKWIVFLGLVKLCLLLGLNWMGASLYCALHSVNFYDSHNNRVSINIFEVRTDSHIQSH